MLGAFCLLAGTLVSNIGTSKTWHYLVDTSQDNSQSFTTGSNSHGYWVSAVVIFMRVSSRTDLTTVVKIRENKTNCMPTTVKNCPGAEVATLTGTVAENNRTYTAPANTVLKPNTTYWVVVNDGVTDNRVGWYTTFDHNETSTDGHHEK